ncbi:hypothetical protein K2173_009201 [Erythroxylum novogranatense]|uniref:Uncharacterized protein n=1 Tax=Erythroxylum novogranatense TaxID=1862640 RepID=A0AAV8TLG2_9ROSI|nr:hypothetical protein K2173_009201 [Erythroxylum novogranatense]
MGVLVYITGIKPSPGDLPENLGFVQKVWLDKHTGGVFLSISFKGLTITGIDDRRYWNHMPTEESRFLSIAYLQQTWWLEVDGQLEFPFPTRSYSIFFRLHLGRAAKRFSHQICNIEHVHGWNKSKCLLDDPRKWNLYRVGDFFVDSTTSSTKLKFSITQIDCTHTKGGLCLDCVIVYPCMCRERFKHFF